MWQFRDGTSFYWLSVPCLICQEVLSCVGKACVADMATHPTSLEERKLPREVWNWKNAGLNKHSRNVEGWREKAFPEPSNNIFTFAKCVWHWNLGCSKMYMIEQKPSLESDLVEEEFKAYMSAVGRGFWGFQDIIFLLFHWLNIDPKQETR